MVYKNQVDNCCTFFSGEDKGWSILLNSSHSWGQCYNTFIPVIYAKCHEKDLYAKCRYAVRRCSECRGATIRSDLLANIRLHRKTSQKRSSLFWNDIGDEIKVL
jgi:hypothetical protein